MNRYSALSKHDLDSLMSAVARGHKVDDAFSLLFETITDGVLVRNRQGAYLVFNASMQVLTGYDVRTANDDVDFVDRLFPDPEVRERFEDAMSEAHVRGRSQPVRLPLRTKTGRRQPVWVTVAEVSVSDQPLLVETYRVEAFDLTRISNSASTSWIHTLIQTVDEGITVSNRDGVFRIFNDKMVEITGYTHEEANAAEDFLALLYPDRETHKRVRHTLRRISETGQARELQTSIVTKEGAVRSLLVSISALRDEGDLWFLAAYRDITSRQRVLDALKLSERKYKSLTEQIPLGIYRTTPDGCVIHGNPALARMLGYESVGAMLDQCVVPSTYVDEDKRQAQHRMLKENEGLVVQEVQLRTYDGRTIWVRDTGRAIFDAGGEIQYIDGTLEDITERRKILEALQRYANEVHARNQELDSFSRTVAHDLKNPLNLITGYTELLLTDRHDLSERTIEKGLSTVVRAARKMSNIIDELLLLAGVRQQEVELCPVDMDRVIGEVRARLVDLLDRQQVELRVPERWPIAWGHEPWVEEVWANYISNAVKYGGDPPTVELGYGTEPLSSVDSSSDALCFWVRDNGEGLTKEAQAHLFVPFERLNRKRVTGHGLGLSIVRRIVEKLGGEVGVESEVGKGSVFYFTLPRRSLES